MHFQLILQGHSFIGRKLIQDVENSTSSVPQYDLCAIDLTTGACLSLETRKMIPGSKNTEILVEKLPIRYELRHAIFSKWKNVTEYEKQIIGQATLTNFRTFSNYGEANIPYRIATERLISFPTNFVRNTHVDLFEGDAYFDNSVFHVGIANYTPIEGVSNSKSNNLTNLNI